MTLHHFVHPAWFERLGGFTKAGEPAAAWAACRSCRQYAEGCRPPIPLCPLLLLLLLWLLLLLRPPTPPPPPPPPHPMKRTSRCLWSTPSVPSAASAASPSTGPPSTSRVGGCRCCCCFCCCCSAAGGQAVPTPAAAATWSRAGGPVLSAPTEVTSCFPPTLPHPPPRTVTHPPRLSRRHQLCGAPQRHLLAWQRRPLQGLRAPAAVHAAGARTGLRRHQGAAWCVGGCGGREGRVSGLSSAAGRRHACPAPPPHNHGTHLLTCLPIPATLRWSCRAAAAAAPAAGGELSRVGLVWNYFTFEAKRYAWWGTPCWSAWIRCGGGLNCGGCWRLQLSAAAQCGGLN